MPLSVPVDIPPSNKIDPIRLTLGNNEVVPSVQTDQEYTELAGGAGNFFALHYDEGTGLLYYQWTNSVRVFNGFEGAQIDELFGVSLTTPTSQFDHTLTIIETELFGLKSESVIGVYDKSSGNNLRDIDFSPADVESFSEKDGNLIVKLDNSTIVECSKTDGEIFQTINTSNFQDTSYAPVFVNGNLVVTTLSGTDRRLDVYEGFSTSFIERVDITSLCSGQTMKLSKTLGFDGVEHVLVYRESGGADDIVASILLNDVSVSEYVCPTDITLKDKDVYFFDVPYGTTETAISLEVNGESYSVASRKGFSIPARSLQGVVPMYFSEGYFTVVSFTEALAANIYGFPLDSETLKDSDLAANGGTIPETDRDNDFGANVQRLNATGGYWETYQSTSNAAALMVFRDNNNNIINRLDSRDYNGVGAGGMEMGGAFTIGTPTGGLRGADTLNVANGLYENGTPVVRTPGTSTDQSALGFNTWRTPSATRATAVFCDLRAETDGTSAGDVRFEVDPTGGTSPAYDQRALADADAGAGFRILESVFQIIPPGASYRINNASDPNAANAIRMLREIEL